MIKNYTKGEYFSKEFLFAMQSKTIGYSINVELLIQ